MSSRGDALEQLLFFRSRGLRLLLLAAEFCGSLLFVFNVVGECGLSLV